MIDNIDDIIKMLKLLEAVDAEKREKEIIYLIHRGDDLQKLLFDLKQKGYTPGIDFETGRLVKLKLTLNKTTFIIRTRQLVTSTIEKPIVVDSEHVYNNMSGAMTQFNKQMFKLGYKSYYNKQDIDILDEYRTFSNSGMLSKKPKEKLNEIDVSKAYTTALIKINKIQIFNEFDIFQPYTGEQIKDYNLYIVKVNSLSLFFNKTYNLCYGMFLKDMDGLEILAYKQPSTLKNVNYKNIVDELYATKISDNPDEDIYIKKNDSSRVITVSASI